MNNVLNIGHFGKAIALTTSLLSIFSPITILAIVIFVFILTDFILGITVSFKIRKEGFISKKAWKTAWKLIGAEICVILAYLLDTYVVSFIPVMFLPNIFAGFICGFDLWSILTNLALLSDHPVFGLIKKWGKREIERKMKINIKD